MKNPEIGVQKILIISIPHHIEMLFIMLSDHVLHTMIMTSVLLSLKVLIVSYKVDNKNVLYSITNKDEILRFHFVLTTYENSVEKMCSVKYYPIFV